MKVRKYMAEGMLLVLLLGTALPGDLPAQEARKAASSDAITLQKSFSDVSSAVQPAVVNISTVLEMKVPEYEFFFAPQGSAQRKGGRTQKRKVHALASGVIVDPRGFILTSAHVVQDAQSIQVTTADNKKYTGKIAGKDTKGDIAVIKIEAGQALPYAKLGDSGKIKVGDWAIAIGSPFGLNSTLTVGVISAKRQSIKIEGVSFSDLIQTDAPINEGNSGGPLCNIDGEVIGINTAIYAPTGVFSGIGFALPVNNVREILADLCKSGNVPCPLPAQ